MVFLSDANSCVVWNFRERITAFRLCKCTLHLTCAIPANIVLLWVDKFSVFNFLEKFHLKFQSVFFFLNFCLDLLPGQPFRQPRESVGSSQKEPSQADPIQSHKQAQRIAEMARGRSNPARGGCYPRLEGTQDATSRHA